MGYTFAISQDMMDMVQVQGVERAILERHLIEACRAMGEVAVKESLHFDRPLVIKTHLETWRDGRLRTYNFAVHCRITPVLFEKVRMVVMDEPLIFTNHEGQREWKCPACGMVNAMAATYCGEKHQHAVGCGRPREYAY